ncbi:MAG: insulinase family protein [Saprospiraceae bacterium]|nr:insulinase family protein [Saprospiraceae bacterium]
MKVVQPPIKSIFSLDLTAMDNEKLSNGTNFFKLVNSELPAFQLDIVIEAGRLFEKYKMTSKATASLLKEGASTMNTDVIAETIDYYGGRIKVWSNMDYITLSLSAMSKHAAPLISVLFDIYHAATFPQSEFDKFKFIEAQRLKVSLSKNENVAYRHFTQALYGENHPYGYNSTVEMINDLSLEHVKAHHRNLFIPELTRIYLGGYIDDAALNLIKELFGSTKTSKHDASLQHFNQNETRRQTFHLTNKGEFQSSVMIGRTIIHRRHEDFPALYMALMLLGGYFGSRLMKEIREELGLTYDISCHIEHMKAGSFFYILSDADSNNVPRLLDEIYHQIHEMQTSLVDENELTMVKRYIMGSYMNLTDGMFRRMQFLKALNLDAFEIEEYNELLQRIYSVGPQEIKNASLKYLKKRNLLEIVVGNDD